MRELNSGDFAEVIASDMPVAVDFWADWCMPCKIFAPVLEQLADEMDGTAEFCKLNVDDEQALAIEYGVASIPTLIVFKNGIEVERGVGVMPKQRVREMLESHISENPISEDRIVVGPISEDQEAPDEEKQDGEE